MSVEYNFNNNNNNINDTFISDACLGVGVNCIRCFLTGFNMLLHYKLYNQSLNSSA